MIRMVECMECGFFGFPRKVKEGIECNNCGIGGKKQMFRSAPGLYVDTLQTLCRKCGKRPRVDLKSGMCANCHDTTIIK